MSCVRRCATSHPQRKNLQPPGSHTQSSSTVIFLGGLMPWQSMLTCVFSCTFSSGTRAYYNGSAFRVYNDSIGADGKLHFSHGLSTAACILWSDGAETGTTTGCSYRADNWPKGATRLGCDAMTGCEEAKAFFKQQDNLQSA